MTQQSHYLAYNMRKLLLQKDTCTPTFIVALFTTARMQKQPKCPSTDELLKMMWYIYAMEYYSVIKRNQTESFVVMQINIESVIQSEVSQKKKNKYHILTHTHTHTHIYILEK